MARSNFNSDSGQDWPSTVNNRLIENDAKIVKVPMDEVEWGARKAMMAKVRNSDGFKENSMAIKHVDDNGKGG